MDNNANDFAYLTAIDAVRTHAQARLAELERTHVAALATARAKLADAVRGDGSSPVRLALVTEVQLAERDGDGYPQLHVTERGQALMRYARKAGLETFGDSGHHWHLSPTETLYYDFSWFLSSNAEAAACETWAKLSAYRAAVR